MLAADDGDELQPVSLSQLQRCDNDPVALSYKQQIRDEDSCLYVSSMAGVHCVRACLIIGKTFNYT